MKIVNCLYYEDKKDEARRYKRWLEIAWDQLELVCPIEISIVESYDTALKELENYQAKYQMLIADILEGDDHNPLGLHLITFARNKISNIAIIALTVGSKAKLDLREAAIDAGADDYIRKDQLDENQLKSGPLGDILRKALIKNGHEPIPVEDITFQYNKDDFNLAPVLVTIGEDTIKILALKLLKTPIDKINLFHISPGLSGAHVLRLDCELYSKPEGVAKVKSVLLKVSNDKNRLQVELDNKELLSFFPSQICAPFVSGEIVDAYDKKQKYNKLWFSIGYEFRKGAKTLIDWIVDENLEKEKIHSTLNTLFLSVDGLKPLYDNFKLNSDLKPNILLYDLINEWRKVSILKAVREFAQLTKYCDTIGDYNPDMVNAFLLSGRIYEADKEVFPTGTKLCMLHGDFHGRNILVSDAGLPCIIDPANIFEGHWATDMARLMVDMIVSGIDTGEQSYMWDKCGEWLNLCQKLIDLNFDYENTESANDRIKTVLSFLIKNLSNIYSQCLDDNNWEFQLALAIEFLRSAYRQDISAPKRVLGLVAGCKSLKRVGEDAPKII